MRKIISFTLVLTLLLVLTGCKNSDDDVNDFDAAVAKLLIEFDDYDKLDIEFVVNINETEILVTFESFLTETFMKTITGIKLDIDGDIVEEEMVEYIEEIEDGFKIYTLDPNTIDQYIVYQTEEDIDDSEMDIGLLFASDDFVYTELGTYNATVKLEDIFADFGEMFVDIMISNGFTSGDDQYLESLVEIIITLNDDSEISEIEMDFSNVFTDLMADFCSVTTCVDFDIINAVMTFAFGYHGLTDLELPTNILIDDNTAIQGEDDIPDLLLNIKLDGSLEYYGDEDIYEFNILESGFYYFDISNGLHFNVWVDSFDYTEIYYENYFATSSNINSRLIYLNAGVYFISITNANITYFQPAEFSITISEFNEIDDYEHYLTYNDLREINITTLESIFLRNDFEGDIDTLYMPYEISSYFLKTRKDVLIVDYQNSILAEFMEFEDYYFYLFSFVNPGTIQVPSWSISFMYENSSISKYFMDFIDPYYDYPDQTLLGILSINDENLLHSFEQCTYELIITTPGNYNFRYAASNDDAYLDFDIFDSYGNYVISISENDYSFYLEPCVYTVQPSSNFATGCIFKLNITQE